MSLKRNLLMLAAYVGVLIFMSLPFAMIDAEGSPAGLARIERTGR